jgi:hypothetical protein
MIAKRIGAFVHGAGRALLVLLGASGLLCAARGAGASAPASGFEYVSPEPDARLVSPWNNIVLRPGPLLDATPARAAVVIVTGARSGVHAGRLVLSDDSRTLVFTPDRPFAGGERVTVSLAPGLRTANGAPVPAARFAFSVTANDPRRMPRYVADDATGCLVPIERWTAPAAASLLTRTAFANDTVPTGIPTVVVVASNQPEAGEVFLAPYSPLAGGGNLMITDNAAQPLFYRRLPVTAFDFKLQPGGLLTYFGERDAFWGLDSTYAVVDSFRAGNGYTADVHDLQVLPNGHALLLSYDVQPVRMDSIVPGGQPDARVVGLVVQELDQAKNVVFQWRSWDHLQITDADTCLISLRDSLVDYVHANAVEMDADGNLLISSRTMSEITKIDRATGDILWRFGPHAKNNQFTIVGDARGFSGQHDIRRLPNGHVTLFDNGNCQSPLYSRGLEFQLDEVNKVATLVWQFRNSPDVYSPFMGNVQRRSSGGTMIGWGGTNPDPKVTDLHADGTVGLALGFKSLATWSYRAFRFPWRTSRFALGADSLDFGVAKINSGDTLAVTLLNRSAAPVTITSIVGSAAPFSAITPLPLTLAAGASDSIQVRFAPTTLGSFRDTLYVRSTNATEIIAQPLVVFGACEASGLWIEDLAQFEGNSGLSAFRFRVRISGTRTRDVSVRFATANGTATTADSDYVATSGRVTIKQGDTTATFTVSVRGDHKVEPDETFFVNLANPLQIAIDDAQATGTIVDDDLLADAGDGGLPLAFALHPAWPNPAHGSAALRFDLPRAVRVRLEVFDLAGRRLASLVDGPMPAGRHARTWAPRGSPTGVFFCRLRAGDFDVTRRLVFVR